ncbi:MAG: TolC family protein [Pyrinomonadaceae bacterium]
MSILVYRNHVNRLLCCALFVVATAGVTWAQVPSASPTPNAATPPGPETQSPTSPPATQQPAPQTPPSQPVLPGVPTVVPGVSTPAPQPSPTPVPEDAIVDEPIMPAFPAAEQRPLPPMPNLTRLGVTSDNTIALSLNDAIKRALANNNDIEVARDDVRFAETQLRSLEGVYDAIFSITPQYDKRITPQTSIFSGATSSGTTSQTLYTLSPTISKAVSFGGGQYAVSFANTKTITNATSSTLNPIFASNLSLSFTQPLWRNRSIDNNRRQIRIQKKRLEQSDADFRQRTIDIISQVQNAYWDLTFALRDQQIQLANLNLTRENLKVVEAQISVGVKAPLERAEVLTELANRESAILTATQTVSTAENTLKQLMLKDTASPEWSAQITPTDTPTVDVNPVNLNDAISEARKNRPDLQRLRIQREINDLDVQFFKNQTKPQIDLQGTLATTGLAGARCIPDPASGKTCPTAVPPANLVGGYAQDLSNLFSFSTRNISIGVAIQIPLRNTTAKANLAGARIQREQLEASMRSQEQVAEVDVRNAAQAVESARLRVVTARTARENAEVQLQGEQRLYAVGRSTTFLLFQRENALANARDQELRAETDYNKARSSLQRATSTTLRANNVIVD